MGTGKTKQKQSGARTRWIFWLALMAVLAYIAVQVVFILMPRMRFQTAIRATMTDSVSAEGFVAMDSVPVAAPEDGLVYYTVAAGERVRAGAEVALLFSSAEGVQAMEMLTQVEEELAMLQTAQKTLAEGGNVENYRRQMQDSLLAYITAVEEGRFADADAPATAFTLGANRLQIATGATADYAARIAWLEGEKQRYAQLAVPVGIVTAPDGGYFVPAAAGMRQQQPAGALAEASAGALQDLLAQTPAAYGADVVGLIVRDYHWRFFAVVPAESAARFEALVGDKQNAPSVSFPESGGGAVPAVVQAVAVDEAAGLARVELASEYMTPDVMMLAQERAEIVFGTYDGIRIDKNALRIVDGVRCVYIKFGNQVYLRRIQILLEDEYYYLVPLTYAEGVNEVQLYDEIIVESGGVELSDKKVL